MIAKIPLERRPVDGSRFLRAARITLKLLAIVFVVLFVNTQLLCEQRVRLALSAKAEQPVIPDSTTEKNSLPSPPHFSRYGEVPEELLGSLKVVPAVAGGWGQASWTDAKASLGGVNAKMICHLLHNNHTELSSSSNHPVDHQDDSRRPYKVLARPIGSREGVGEEYLAYSVARELGIHKIPTQSIIAHPRKGHRGIINIQSMLEGVQLTFLDNWTNCLPRPSKMTTHSTSLEKNSNPDASFLSSTPVESDAKTDNAIMVDIGHNAAQNNASQWIRLQSVQTDPQAVMRICFRNYTLNDDDWKRWCEEHGPVAKRNCRQQEIAQLIEMAMFDAIIHNEERLHVELHQGKSNNVHWIWPATAKRDDPPALNPDDALQLVWIDHSHYTFMNKTKLGPDGTGEMMQFFSDYCIFPGNLLRQVFANPRPLSARVMERLHPKLSIAEKHGDGQARVVAARTLEVVDRQVQYLRQVVARCANQQHEPPGVVHVMDYDSDSFL